VSAPFGTAILSDALAVLLPRRPPHLTSATSARALRQLWPPNTDGQAGMYLMRRSDPFSQWWLYLCWQLFCCRLCHQGTES